LIRRWQIALFVGVISSGLAFRYASLVDFTDYPLRAARHLVHGRNPYNAMPPVNTGTGGPLLYPLTAVLVALPFGWMAARVAGSLFVGLSAAALALGLASAPWRLLFFLSPSFILAAYWAQWSPIVTAGALVPAIAWLGIAKPNLWVPLFAYRPSWRGTAAAGAFGLASLAILPNWPLDWLVQLRAIPITHAPPALWPLGAIGLVGMLRWRTPEGRLLVAMTALPSAPLPYDHLALLLIARNRQELFVLVVVSWAGFLAILITAPHDLARNPQIVQLLLALSIYAPAAALVYRHPNLTENFPRGR
jgi:hypothetical protein